MDRAEIKQFYDDRWDSFRYANRFKLIRTAAILECLAAARLSEPTILDLGCGAGWLTNILGMFGAATGVDLSGKAVSTARERFPHAEFFEADLASWLPDRVFDVIISQEVLEHFVRHEDFVDVVKRLLKPGGTLILTTPNARTLAAMSAETQHQDQPVENPVTAAQLSALLAADFETLRLTTVIGGFGSSGLWNRLLQSRWTSRIADALGGAGTGSALPAAPGLACILSGWDGGAKHDREAPLSRPRSLHLLPPYFHGGPAHLCVAFPAF